MSKQELKQKGFTIIEVVLVLAIAALIFLMVFIALPALQRSQRDTARKNDASIVATGVTSWQGNNRSSSTFPTADQIKQYAESLSGNTSELVIGTAPDSNGKTYTATDGQATVVPQAKCNAQGSDGSVTLDKGTLRQFVVITRLEGGNNSGYCFQS